jgi:hypothetical protein
VTKVLINPIIRTRTRHSRHAYQPTRDNKDILRVRVYSVYWQMLILSVTFDSLLECDAVWCGKHLSVFRRNMLYPSSKYNSFFLVGWNSVVGTATGYGLDDRGVEVQVPVVSRIFYSPRRPDWL